MPDPVLRGIHHLKLPVSDLEASLAWWQRAVDAERLDALDHRDVDGELFAVELRIPGVDVQVELRLNPERAPDLRNFDPITFLIGSQQDAADLARRLDR
ncbi:VOC family protein [Micromonospora sp. GCM10011542]|uniref:VOC family protein n=1 Tax=Micromonospora sp. GCM10011542 TaxID=3317337 RepID=UPI0036093DEC